MATYCGSDSHNVTNGVQTFKQKEINNISKDESFNV